MRQLLMLFLSFLLFACNQSSPKTAQGKWIKGSQEDQLKSIENQFGGFDQAMVETGYRYQELYWAGQDQNWDYAEYQLNNMKKTLDHGLERRPKRAESADSFMNHALPEMQEAIEKKDPTSFNAGFDAMTINCNSCHLKEKVPFIRIKKPVNRASPVQF